MRRATSPIGLLGLATALLTACGGVAEPDPGPDRGVADSPGGPGAPAAGRGTAAPDASPPAPRADAPGTDDPAFAEPLAVVVFRGRGMGVPARLAVAGGEWGVSSVAQREAFALLSRLEDAVNLWDAGSELARWNDGPPAGGRVSAELGEVLAAAMRLCWETGGRFDPTVGALLAARGHYGDPVPLAGDPAELVGCGTIRLVHDATSETVLRDHPGVRLDVSGVAKGWAADRMKAHLVAAGVTNACLDLGGSTVVAWGPGPDGRGWWFGLGEGAEERGWWLRDEAVATSGRAPRAIDPADLTGVHLIEPESGADVAQDALVCVARGASALACDGWATAGAVAGPSAFADGRLLDSARHKDDGVARSGAAASSKRHDAPHVIFLEPAAPPASEDD